MIEPTEMPLALWTRIRSTKHVLQGRAHVATCRIRLNRPCAATMWSFVKLAFDHLLLIGLLLQTEDGVRRLSVGLSQ